MTMHYDELPGGMRADRDYEEPDTLPDDLAADFKRGLRIACLLSVPIWAVIGLVIWTALP